MTDKQTDIGIAAAAILKCLNYEAQYGMKVWLVSARFEPRLARAMDSVLESKIAAALIQDLSRKRKAWGWNSDSSERRADIIRRAIEARLNARDRSKAKR